MSTEVDRAEVERILTLLRLEDRRQATRYCRRLEISGDALLQVVIAGRHAGLHDYVYDCHFSLPDGGQLDPHPAEVRDLVALAANGLVPLNRDVRRATQILASSFDRPNGFMAHLLYNRPRSNWHLFCFKGEGQPGASRIHYSRNGICTVPLTRLWRELCTNQEMPRSIGIRYRPARDLRHAAHIATEPKPA